MKLPWRVLLPWLVLSISIATPAFSQSGSGDLGTGQPAGSGGKRLVILETLKDSGEPVTSSRKTEKTTENGNVPEQTLGALSLKAIRFRFVPILPFGRILAGILGFGLNRGDAGETQALPLFLRKSPVSFSPAPLPRFPIQFPQNPFRKRLEESLGNLLKSPGQSESNPATGK